MDASIDRHHHQLVRWAVILIAVVLAQYATVAAYFHPYADDFSYAVAGMRTDLLPRLLDEYRLWNGRWASNALVLRGPLVLGMEWGLRVYRLVPIALLVLSLAGAFSLFRASIEHPLRNRMAAFGACLFVLCYLQLMPDLGEGIYWYTGAISYQLPSALLLMIGAGWVKTWRSGWRMSAWQGTALSLAGALVAGFTEAHMVGIVMLQLLVLMAYLRGAPEGRIGWPWIAMAMVLAGAVAMALAPGNAIRSGFFPERHQLGRTLVWSILQTVRFMGLWLLSPTLLCLSVLLYRFLPRLRTHAPVLQKAAGLPMRVIALIWILPVLVLMALPYWAQGLLGQHRTVNLACLAFFPGWLLALNRLTVRWAWPARTSDRPWPLALASAGLVVAMLFTGNGGRVVCDLYSGQLARFDSELMARYSEISAARKEGRKELVVSPVVHQPSAFHYIDGAERPEWINRSLAQYFRADSLSILILPGR
jgi:hypothetical protein